MKLFLMKIFRFRNSKNFLPMNKDIRLKFKDIAKTNKTIFLHISITKTILLKQLLKIYMEKNCLEFLISLSELFMMEVVHLIMLN